MNQYKKKWSLCCFVKIFLKNKYNFCTGKITNVYITLSCRWYDLVPLVRESDATYLKKIN